MQEYIIATDDKARERLDIQHALYREGSLRLIEKAKLKPGMKGLEIGCGSGAMTLELINYLGSDGELLAIDLLEEQIAATKKRCQDYPNIKCMQFDVKDIASLEQGFDFIYCRMVLHHLPQGNEVLKQFTSLLTKGGKLIIEEPEIGSGMFSHPPAPALAKVGEWIGRCFSSNERDYKVCFNMYEDLKALGLDILCYDLAQTVMTTPQQKQLMAMALDDFTPQLLDKMICSADEIEHLKPQLQEIVANDTVISGKRMHQIIAA